MAQHSDAYLTRPAFPAYGEPPVAKRVPSWELEKMRSLAGRNAVVTGASRGIGRAIAIELGRRGASVAVNYNSSAAAATDVVADIERNDSAAVAIQADTADISDVRGLMEQATVQLGGPLDIVVSNAGIERFAAIEDETEESFDRLFAVNTRGQFFVVQQAVAHMKAGGHIVCTSSISAHRGFARHALYAASKAAVEGMVRSLAVELGPRGITINAVVPGGVNTDMASEHGRAYGGDYSGATLSSTEVEVILGRAAPLGRGAVPADIAKVVAFLVSDDAEWINGQPICVTGGA